MITRVSAMFTKWLLNSGAISENDRELYEYAAYSFLFSLLPLCLVVILGCITGMVIEGILMIFPFMLIRKFSGGFHLKSSTICLISSTLLLSFFLLLIKVVTTEARIVLFTCFVFASTIQIFLCSPIDNEASAVLTFQANQGITSDGIVGPGTWTVFNTRWQYDLNLTQKCLPDVTSVR